jgi:hypothetical protein
MTRWGITTNGTVTGTTARTTPDTCCPDGPADKADQVWLWATNFAVPWTNNAFEQALKGQKRHQAVPGYWPTLATVEPHCRVHSYLITTKGHSIRGNDAIHAVLAGRPWLPARLGPDADSPPVNGHIREATPPSLTHRVLLRKGDGLWQTDL